jgi:hypothetical protein
MLLCCGQVFRCFTSLVLRRLSKSPTPSGFETVAAEPESTTPLSPPDFRHPPVFARLGEP